MNYVFCGAYKALLFALYLKNVEGKKITILTNSKDITKYCEDEKIKCIKFDFIRPAATEIYKLIKLKKMLDDVIKKIDFKKEDSFFITERIIGFEQIYLAKTLAKKGKVYSKITHRDLKKHKPSGIKSFFIRGEILKIMVKLVLDLDLIYYESNKDPRLGFDEEYLRKCNIKNYKPDEKSEDMILEAVKKTKSSYKEIDNLIVDQGPNKNLIELNSVKKLYEEIFNLSIDFALKKHPFPIEEKNNDTISYYNTFEDCEELPEYVPSELFYNNTRQNVISLFSASLITASQFDHLKAISLLELIDWRHKSYKKEFKKHLAEESNNKILFPASLEELKEILLNS